jgi:uncharacterized membrane protein YfcA
MAKAPAARSWHFTRVPYRALPGFLLAWSVLYALAKMESLEEATRTPEAYLLIFCFGLSFFVSEMYEFLLGAASALSGITLSAVINSFAVRFIVYSSLFIKEIVNTITISICLAFAVAIFWRYVSSKDYLLWCVLAHFLLMGIFQRDQFGADFFPYTAENPIQWAVIFIFASSLALRQLFSGLFYARRR